MVGLWIRFHGLMGFRQAHLQELSMIVVPLSKEFSLQYF
jgi:hypothetical protein